MTQIFQDLVRIEEKVLVDDGEHARFLSETDNLDDGTDTKKAIEYDLRSPTFILLLILVALVLVAICLIIFCFRNRRQSKPKLVSKESQTEIISHYSKSSIISSQVNEGKFLL